MALWRIQLGSSARFAVACMLGALLLFPLTASAYLALVTFGDSYTDTWRLPSSPPQYWNGRFSNGPVWVEYLAQHLGLAYDPNNNFAVSGSETDELGTQIGNFAGTGAGLDVVCAIWSGNNDFSAHLNLGTSDSAWNTQINKIVTSLSTACELLYQKGARRIVLFNQLDITELPQIRRGYSSSFRSYLEGKINTFNSRLSTAAESLRSAHSDLDLILFDVNASFQGFVANYSFYGFTTSLIDVLSDPSLTDKSFGGPGADYVFWDGQHPTTKTHSLIADAVANLLPAPPPPASLPPPWQQTDVGDTGLAGAAGAVDDSFTVQGSGADIWGSADAFHFVFQPWSGDGVILAHVTSLGNTDGFAKAGVMFRESRDPGAANVFAFITPSGSSGLQSRDTTGDTTAYTEGPQESIPSWIKLERTNSSFSMYVSEDGATWNLLGSYDAALGSSVLVGLAVTAHNNATITTAEIESVRLMGGTPTPTLSLISPKEGAVYASLATIVLSADASAVPELLSVQFLDGGILLAQLTNAPYTFSWTNAPAGTNQLSARAIYGSGESIASQTIAVEVTPPLTSPRLSIELLSDGSIQLRLSGSSGSTWRTESSSDLNSWSAISTNTLTGGSTQFNDSATRTTPLRFYRAIYVQ